jgi:hypothetical protein
MGMISREDSRAASVIDKLRDKGIESHLMMMDDDIVVGGITVPAFKSENESVFNII